MKEKKYSIIDDNIFDTILEKIKEIKDIEKFDDAILIDANDKLPNNISLKYVVMLMTCAIKKDDKFYPQIFLEEALYVKTKCHCFLTNKTSS